MAVERAVEFRMGVILLSFYNISTADFTAILLHILLLILLPFDFTLCCRF